MAKKETDLGKVQRRTETMLKSSGLSWLEREKLEKLIVKLIREERAKCKKQYDNLKRYEAEKTERLGVYQKQIEQLNEDRLADAKDKLDDAKDKIRYLNIKDMCED